MQSTHHKEVSIISQQSATNGLPSEGLVVMHPLTLSTHCLFDNVTGTSPTTIEITNIPTYFLHFHTSISRTYGTTYPIHDFIVRYIITHIDDFMVMQIILLQKFIISFDFHSALHIDIFNAKMFIPQTYAFRIAPREDGNTKT